MEGQTERSQMMSEMKMMHNDDDFNYDSVIKQYNEAMHTLDDMSKKKRQEAKLDIYANPAFQNYIKRENLMHQLDRDLAFNNSKYE